jgi:hypothetical protein
MGCIEKHNMGDFLTWLLDHKMQCLHIYFMIKVTHYFLAYDLT